MKLSKLFRAQTQVRDFALVTHVVPLRRLKRAMPAGLSPESFLDQQTGEELGFISVGCFKNSHFHSAAFKKPELNFPQITFRTYTQFKGKPAVYFFGSDVGTWPSCAIQKMSFAKAEKGDIEILVNRDNFGDYDIYECNAKSEHGALGLSLRAKKRPTPKTPFATGADKAHFLTQRLHGVMRTPYGFLGDQMVYHQMMRPLEGELLDFKCDYWVKLGLLKEDEAQKRFYCALVTPSIDFTLYPPVPAQFVALVS